jgi:hypothetical protein
MALSGLQHGQRVAYRGHLVTVWAQTDKSRHWWVAQQGPEGLHNFASVNQLWMYPPTEQGLADSIEYAAKKDAQAVTA